MRKFKCVLIIIMLIMMLISFSGCKSKTDTEPSKPEIVENTIDDEEILVEDEVEEENEPYIPEGFSALDESLSEDDGFVVADEAGNQYVWVPVKSGKLSRSISSEDMYEDDASELANSVSKYYGFYVSRFEASQYEHEDEYVAASMPGKMPWTNIDYTEAETEATRAGNVYEYEDCYTNLMNGSAWDTILAWADRDEDKKGYSKNTEYGNYSGQLLPTGKTKEDIVKNICDLAGNAKEWTTEIDKSREDNNQKENDGKYRVLRGGSAELEQAAAKRISYEENQKNETWGFRIILYKK